MTGKSDECTALMKPVRTNRLTLLFYALIILLIPERGDHLARLFRIRKKASPRKRDP